MKNEKTVTTRKKAKAVKSKSLLDAIESVATHAGSSQLCEMFFVENKKELKFLADTYGITPRQAALFCVCMEKGPRHLDFDALASQFDFNGGQIENVARKYAVSCILHGDAADPQQVLEELCANERIDSHNGARRIGFGK